jgi:hypothetical protein
LCIQCASAYWMTILPPLPPLCSSLIIINPF